MSPSSNAMLVKNRVFLCLLESLLVSLLMLFGGGSALAADEFPGVKKLMNNEEFQNAGLHRLSREELDLLDAWLVRYTAVEAETLSATIPEIKKLKTKPIVSAIQGKFTGWTGNTLFRLENGQVWRQRNKGYFRYRKPEPPIAIIEKNSLGFYSLKIEGQRRKIGVLRIK